MKTYSSYVSVSLLMLVVKKIYLEILFLDIQMMSTLVST